MSDVWTCDRIPEALADWRSDSLSQDQAQGALAHALRCPRCLSRTWIPMTLETSQAAGELLDELTESAPRRATPTRSSSPTAAGIPTPAAELPDAAHSLPAELPPPLWPGGQIPWLRTVGTVLPRVPRPEVLRGYRWYLGGGAPRPTPDLPFAAALHVTAGRDRDDVSVESLGPGLSVDGDTLPLGSVSVFRHTHLIECGEWRYLLEVGGVGQGGWRGAGVLRHAGPCHALDGARLVIGRDLGCEIPLLDRPGTAHLEWRVGAMERLSATDQRRLTDLTLDAVDVHRRHAEVVGSGDKIYVRGLGGHPVYRIHGGEVAITQEGSGALPLLPGDLLRVGHSLFELRSAEER